MNKKAKEDYIHGLKILREASRASGFGIYTKIMSSHWIKPFCKYLAGKNICGVFWENVIAQGNIRRVPKCTTVNDMLHGNGKCLFVWGRTPQGSGFWLNFETNMFSDFGTIYEDVTKLLEKYQND